MVKAMKVANQVAQQLLALIAQQGLNNGDRLPAERQLCEQLGVSRTALREAMQRLGSVGITETRIGSGTYVKDAQKARQAQPLEALANTLSDSLIVQTLTPLLDADPLYRLDVQEARIVLEGGTAWYAAQRATEQDIKKIRFYYDQLADSQAHGDTEQAAIADASFHLAIAEASHNAVLLQMMKNVFHLLRHNVVLARRKIYTERYGFDTLHSQHRTILQAISDHDADHARVAVGEHIDFVITQVSKIDASLARQQRVSRVVQL